MELTNGESFSELVESHALFLNRLLSFASPMSLKCAVELGIADLIHSHGRAMSLSELARSIPIPPEKAPFLGRLMRLLVSQGIFEAQRKRDNEKETAYLLTPISRLLLSNGTNMSTFCRFSLDLAIVKPWLHMKDWFKREGSTPFELAHDGKAVWELTNERPEINDLFNQAMACDANCVMKAVVTECAHVFRGLKSLVDVGGGTGISARIIAEAFPDVRCTVLDLPHVVAAFPETKLVDAVGGNMFDYIPPANATFLKINQGRPSTNDSRSTVEECDATFNNQFIEPTTIYTRVFFMIGVLKRCKEAIPPKEEGGKVIIVAVIKNSRVDNRKITETHLFYDLCMIIIGGGKEREEYEWQKIFNDAGFKEYKIFPIIGIYSVIEVYP